MTLNACRQLSSFTKTGFASTNEALPLFARPDTNDALFNPGSTQLSSSFVKRPPGHEDFPEAEKLTHQEKSAVSASGHWAPEASVMENEFGYVMQVVLPGVRAQEVRAELVPGGKLVINGVRHGKVGSAMCGTGDNASTILGLLSSSLPRELGLGGGSTMGRIVYGGDVLVPGRFKLVWKLPKDANLESLRADFKVRFGEEGRRRFIVLLYFENDLVGACKSAL